ncbi:transporter substrate-binding domain-containing protein [Corticibacterium sp. UT-5YL-CI-8]|nr:transporter substrate-binding domain-containing protein [Tianweitania sp. UT-5YL-CI-8]
MPLFSSAPAFWLIAILCFLVVQPARADALADIKARGELVAGVKADYQPFGYRDRQGNIVGFDADVAAGLAETLGVPVRLVPVTSSNRLQKLAAGDVDVVVATLGDTIDRRRLVRMIEPGYYGGGASILVLEDSPIRAWSDIAGKPLCAVQGALWNRLAATRLLADIRAFANTRDAELALRERNCAGWLYDEAALQHALTSGAWPNYRLLPADFVSPWAIAVASDGPLADQFDQTVAGWLRDGHLKALEAKWRLPPAAYLQDAGALWSKRDDDGQWHCRRDADGRWTADCRDLDLIEAQDLQGFGAIVLSLRDRFGVDLTAFYDPYGRDLFLKALLTTCILAISVIAGSLLVGFGGAALLRMRIPGLTQLIATMLTVLRMTPPLLQLYLVFFGIGGLLATHGFSLNAMIVAIAVLSLYAGAANAVTLADASATIAANATDRRRRIAVLAYPAVMGSCINIVKATAMASAIAVPELVYASTTIIADYGNGGVMMNILLACYVATVLVVVQGFKLFERKVLQR